MNPDDFRSPDAGKVVKTSSGYYAFIPAPLPPKIPYDRELVQALSQADAALGELSGLGRLLPNPHLLINPYMRREAVLSSRIEGTKAEMADLWLDEVEAGRPDRDAADIREVRNYITALEFGIGRLGELPISKRLTREVHARLMKGVRGEASNPGEFRRTQNWIGPPGSTLASALFVPPPPDEMQTALDNWEIFLHEREGLPDLIQCAVMHEQFEAIHPFLDGNGRVGRLLITLFLIERSRLSQPLLYLSQYFEARRQGYYTALQRVRTDGDWIGWVQYFLEGVTLTARQALQQAGTLLDLREAFRLKYREKPRVLALLDELFINPYVTAARAADLLQVSNPTARQTITVLQQDGLLEEITGRSWGRVYLARPILTALEQPASLPGKS
jgi:Fic family protein